MNHSLRGASFNTNTLINASVYTHLFCFGSAPKVHGERARFPHFMFFYDSQARWLASIGIGLQGRLMVPWAKGNGELIRLGAGIAITIYHGVSLPIIESHLSQRNNVLTSSLLCDSRWIPTRFYDTQALI